MGNTLAYLATGFILVTACTNTAAGFVLRALPAVTLASCHIISDKDAANIALHGYAIALPAPFGIEDNQ